MQTPRSASRTPPTCRREDWAGDTVGSAHPQSPATVRPACGRVSRPVPHSPGSGAGDEARRSQSRPQVSSNTAPDHKMSTKCRYGSLSLGRTADGRRASENPTLPQRSRRQERFPASLAAACHHVTRPHQWKVKGGAKKHFRVEVAEGLGAAMLSPCRTWMGEGQGCDAAAEPGRQHRADLRPDNGRKETNRESCCAPWCGQADLGVAFPEVSVSTCQT